MEEKQQNIPQRVIDDAAEHGYNKVRYVGVYKGKQVFSVGFVHPDGMIIPTGLPTLLLWDGKTSKYICGMESFDIKDAIRSNAENERQTSG